MDANPVYEHLTQTVPDSILGVEICKDAYTYSPQQVQGLLDTLYSGEDSDGRADVVRGLNRMHRYYRALLVFLAQGYSESEVATKLHVSRWTVWNHRPQALWQLTLAMNGGREL